MKRLAIGTVLLVGLVVAAAVATRASTADTQSSHAPFHIGCPPGSHGKPRTDGVGQRLQQARDDVRTRRVLPDQTLQDRSLTNGHPKP